MKAKEYLELIPEHLRDVKDPDLADLTPRQVVEEGHVDFTAGQPGCKMCANRLRILAGVA